MKRIELKEWIAAMCILIGAAFSSCKNNPDPKNEETQPAVVSTEGDTVHVDTANVPVDSGKSKHPILRKNSEDGTDSGL